MKPFLIILLFTITSLTYAKKDLPNVGDVAPNFEITQLDGNHFRLSDYKGKKSVYLVFWNTWCHYCMKKIPKLKATQSNLSDKIKIIAVNTTNKDTLDESIAFKKRFKINYPFAFDFGEKVTDAYNVWGTPTEFIIDIDGIIQYRDKVPDDIEANLAQWNTSSHWFSMKIKNYYQLIVNIFNSLQKIS